MEILSTKELIENAHNHAIDQLSLEIRMSIQELVNKMIISKNLILIMLSPNEFDMPLWWNRYYPYYRNFILYLAKHGQTHLLKEPKINLDVKNEQIYVNYRLTSNRNLLELPSHNDLIVNGAIIVTEF